MNTSSQMLRVTPPPFWHCGKTLKSITGEVIIALLPVVLCAALVWGISALSVICLSVAVSIATEALCQKLMNRTISVDDYTAVLTGLLLAFMLPAASPWWLVTLAAFFSITMGKMAFGGLGASPLCAPAVGFILCQVSFPVFMDPNAMQLTTSLIDPLVKIKYFGPEALSNISYSSLLMGEQISALGAGQAGLLLLAGVYLCYRGFISWEIAFSFLAGVVITALLFNLSNPDSYVSPLFHVLTGSTILGAFFLATDMSSSPNTPMNMFIYGFTGGVLVILIRVFGMYADGVPFAILLINLIMPLLEGKKRKPLEVE